MALAGGTWLIGSAWELRAAVVEELPPAVTVRLGDRDLRVPPLPWLLSADVDIADLLERLTAAGWQRPAGSPGEV